MRRKLIYLILALAAAAAASVMPMSKAEAACKKICCPGEPPICITCCSQPCPTIVCPP